MASRTVEGCFIYGKPDLEEGRRWLDDWIAQDNDLKEPRARRPKRFRRKRLRKRGPEKSDGEESFDEGSQKEGGF